MQTTTTRFVIDASTPGLPKVQLDGADVTDALTAVAFEMGADGLARLSLFANSLCGTKIEGEGIVQVVTEAATGDAVRALDPDEVKRRAVHGLDLGSDFTGSVLAVVAAMLDEQAG